MKALHALALAAAALLVVALASAAVFVYSGTYNVAATRQHTQMVYSVLELALSRSVKIRARDIETPPGLDAPQRIAQGGLIYRDSCAQCHGAPGVAPSDIGKSMQPIPGPLVATLQRWNQREIYWLTRYGIKMSGMPAWEFRMDEEALWDVVAFVTHLPELSPQAYAALAGTFQEPAARRERTSAAAVDDTAPGNASVQQAVPTVPVMPGNSGESAARLAASDAAGPRPQASVERGRQALHQYACNACHMIPGVSGSDTHVGPPLAGMATRNLIAGRLTNTPQNMRQWLQQPQVIKPLNAMPDMGVTKQHAADMAAYLATLR